MKTNQKKIVLLAAFSLVLTFIIFSSFASAEFWACFSKGQHIDFCNPKVPDRTAGSDNYILCMSNFNQSGSCYNQGNWMVCNSQSPSCTGNSSHGGIDQLAPNFTFYSPIHNKVYKETGMRLDLKVNERADIYFIDYLSGKTKYNQICRGCLSYNRTRGFKEGWNNITFKAVDAIGNTAYKNISFLIDSKKPRISKSTPSAGFASGNFEVKFQELNPTKLVLYYGNNTLGFKNHTVNIADCMLNKTDQYTCSFFLDISSMDKKSIVYYYNITDIAGSTVQNKPTKITVDTVDPIINNITQIKSGRSLTLTLNVTEANFGSAQYIDNSAFRPKWTTFCSSLRNGECKKTLSLSSGFHSIDIRVEDKAGNFASRHLEVTI